VILVVGVLLRPFTRRYHSLMRLTVSIGKGDVLDMAAVKAATEIRLTSVRDYAARIAAGS
jgi:hypothetical protein